MQQWEYCEVDFDGDITWLFSYDEAGSYIDRPEKFVRLGVLLARLGNDGWEVISTWWRSTKEVTYMLKRARSQEWTEFDRRRALAEYQKNRPRDFNYQKSLDEPDSGDQYKREY